MINVLYSGTQKVYSKLQPFRLIICIFGIILFSLFFGAAVPFEVKKLAFTVSDIIRKSLMFMLPFLVFPFIVSSIASIKSNSTYLIIGMAILILGSNFASIMLAYFVGANAVPWLGLKAIQPIADVTELLPYVDLNIKPLVEMEFAMLASLLVGLVLSYIKHQKTIDFFNTYMKMSTTFFQKVYVPILPLYVLGTLLKMSHEIELASLFSIFGSMIFLIFLIQLSYIFFHFYVGSKYRLQTTLEAIKNSLPAGFVAFSSLSSIITMPVTMAAAEKNIPDKNVARLTIAGTVNCHTIGDCISLPIVTLTLYYMNFHSMPSFSLFFAFAIIMALAQFTAVSVPGGSIIIILPFLVKYLGFSPDMLSLIIAISIFIEPLGTANNVMGNSAFAMSIYRIYERFSKSHQARSHRLEDLANN